MNSLKQYQNKFIDKRKKTYPLYFLLIFILCGFLTFLILCITDRGLELIAFEFNKYVIITILISSICLGTSTFIIQTLTSNKLADTTSMGIGSINLIFLTILVSNIYIGNTNDINWFNQILPFVYIFGSSLACIIIFILTSKYKFKISKKFILAGILLNFAFTAISTSIASTLPSTKQAIINNYSLGLIQQSSDYNIIISSIFTILCLLWFLILIPKYKIVTTNPIIASQLGINIKSINWQVIFISAILTAMAFLLVGNVVFLGLVASNICFTIFKRNYKYTFISSGLVAYIILGTTYFINRNLLTGTNINTANLIPLIATPYFMYLLLRK